MSRQLVEAQGDEGPGAHVPRLFLDPNPICGLGITDQGGFDGSDRPGIKLLQADDRHLVVLAFQLAPGEQIVVDLAAADDDSTETLRPPGGPSWPARLDSSRRSIPGSRS